MGRGLSAGPLSARGVRRCGAGNKTAQRRTSGGLFHAAAEEMAFAKKVSLAEGGGGGEQECGEFSPGSLVISSIKKEKKKKKKKEREKERKRERNASASVPPHCAAVSAARRHRGPRSELRGQSGEPRRLRSPPERSDVNEVFPRKGGVGRGRERKKAAEAFPPAVRL